MKPDQPSNPQSVPEVVPHPVARDGQPAVDSGPAGSPSTPPLADVNDSTYFQTYRKPILLVALLLLAAGLFAYQRMQTALFPEVTFPKITLIADAGQQPIDRMMITVTKPLESAVKRVKGVTIVKSSTSRGSCVIEVYLTWDVDVYATKTQLESRINEIKGLLPAGVTISTEAMNQSLFPVLGYTLESNSRSPIALRDAANLVARPLFSQVAGASNVVVRGGKAKEYVVIPDPVKLTSLGIPPATLLAAFANSNFVLSNGNVANFRRLYLTLTDTRLGDVRDLENVVVRADAGRVVRLRDVARVDVQEQQEFVIINANGHDAVLLDLVKQQGVNLVNFARDANAKAEEVRRQLPPGMTLKPYYDQSAFVGDSIDSVVHSIVEGLALAIVVMILFLRSWRASLVVLLTIPVTVGFTLLVLYLFGISINIMSLGAIAASVGLIIDDAIVIIEQIYRVHEEHPEESKFRVVREAIRDLFPAMVASSLSTIVIHFPFRLMSGLAGSFFKELSDTMQITMVCSFLVTWLLLPVLHLVIGYRPGKQAHAHNAAEEQAEKLGWLTRLFARPVLAIVFVLVLGGGAYLVSGKLETGFLPDLDEGTIVLDYYSPPGTSLEETDRMLRQAEQLIIAHPEVESYSRRTGIRMAFRTVPANYGDYSIQLRKDHKLSTPQVIDQLRQRINATQPALTIDFGQRIADLLGDLMSTPSPIEIKIFGDNQATLEKLAHQAGQVLARTPGVADVEDGLVVAGPSIVFRPDLAKLGVYKITPTDFQAQLSVLTGGVPLVGTGASQASFSPAQSAMLGGVQVGQVQDGEQMRQVLLRFVDFQQNSLEQLKKQLIFLPDGTAKPLPFFTAIAVEPGDVDLRREDLKSAVVLTARLNGRDLGSAIKELQQQLGRQLNLPPGYTVVYGGAYAEQQASFRELELILLTASLLVFTVLLFLFREWLISLLILFISVMGIAGCLLGLYFTGIPLNVSSYTGIIMMVGIIAENAIFTVNQFYASLAESGDVDTAIRFAIGLRIRPKLMTAIGAILALMPLALGIGLGAQMQQPLAVAVIGGFLVALPLLLFVLPSGMRLIYHRRNAAQELADRG
ncbi:efflux RND transporter permease subunit [Hymenobacter metallilatus]|uniref:Efflux RND transporter permease subunit n=1 Tax=Hymenobacter metallilatus TaxID=2493666 RepID=A0A428IZR6_9BACT|nr:efflux RND transporter permease subunit [Hymenobacter metallilatus]RSK24984.1 efflux RND transporter permease subunit [Hymenobacter metallilatus]